MRRVWLVLLVVTLLAGTVHAQGGDPSGYRLRVPSAEEFLLAVPVVAERTAVEDHERLVRSLLAEMIARYGFAEHDERNVIFAQDFAAQSAAYQVLGMYSFPRNQTNFPLYWNLARLERWLVENPTDLDAVEVLNLSDDMGVTVQPVDFTGDGVFEYLLDVRSGDLRLFYLALPDANSPGGYWVNQTPLPFTSLDPAIQDGPHTGTVSTLMLEDINDDGRDEWVVSLEDYHNYDGSQCRHYYLVAWEDDRERLWDMGRGYLESCESAFSQASWNFNWPEVSVHKNYIDSWDCHAGTSSFFVTWDGTEWSYEFGEGWGDASFECRQSAAEHQMRNGSFAEAAVVYEAALAEFDQGSERLAFARARLALAYALNGDLDAAADILAEPPASRGQMGDLFRAMAAAFGPDRRFYPMCLAAYDYFAVANAAADPETYPYSVPVGWVSARGNQWEPEAGLLPDPATAGCDPVLAVDALLDLHEFPLGEPLAEQFAALHIPVTAVEETDEGGQLWIEGQAVPLGFRSQDANYNIWRRDPSSSQQESAAPDWAFVLRRMNYLLEEENFDGALTLTTDAIAQAEAAQVSAYEMQLYRYWRAVALEYNGEIDEALAAYVTIYEAAPDSAWGLLAGLHLEPTVEN